LPSRVTVFGRLYDQTLGATFFGVVNNLPPNIDAGGRTLDQALCEALMVSPWILATFGDTTVAIFRHDNCLFVFDSHARNTFGFPDADGASILMSFHSQGSLAEYLQQMYSLRIFNISPIIHAAEHIFKWQHSHHSRYSYACSLETECKALSVSNSHKEELCTQSCNLLSNASPSNICVQDNIIIDEKGSEVLISHKGNTFPEVISNNDSVFIATPLSADSESAIVHNVPLHTKSRINHTYFRENATPQRNTHKRQKKKLIPFYAVYSFCCICSNFLLVKLHYHSIGLVA
jgi:hypothetical protein